MSSAPTPTDLLIDALATSRATRLITDDEITRTPREFILHTHPPASSKLGYLITCPYCSSIYVAAAITLTHTRPFRKLRPLVYLLAIAAPTAILADRKASSTGWS